MEQKLEGRNTYTPQNAPQVLGNCDSALNREETLSVSSLKTLFNISDVDYSQHRGSSDLRVQDIVYVLNMRGQPLMPTTQQKANKILKQNKANVVQRTPFTIQLKYPTGEAKQDITLGIDAGYSTVGYSAVTENRELIAGELELRNDIKRLLEKRSAYRRTRRSRLWHREARFNNRAKDEGWLAPSIQHKLDSHVKLVEKLKKILPITKVTVEVASFDTQKMQKPEIAGVEYQQGELQGYEVREYLLEKWHRKCAYCGKKDVPLEIEHIVPKSKGGSNRVSNLTISCHECNIKKGNQTAEEFGHPKIQSTAKKSLRATAFMNIVRHRLVGILDCNQTYGYITKHNRIKLGLEKSHVNDAFVIAGGSNQVRAGHTYKAKHVRRQNRSLFKANLLKGGRRKRNTVREVNGFKRFDAVNYNGTGCFIFGLRSSGYFNLRTIDGEKIEASVNNKKLKLLEHARGIIQEVCAIPSTTEVVGIIAQF